LLGISHRGLTTAWVAYLQHQQQQQYVRWVRSWVIGEHMIILSVAYVFEQVLLWQYAIASVEHIKNTQVAQVLSGLHPLL
jgi:hypothetical protein